MKKISWYPGTALLLYIGTVFAGQPDSPRVFGKDRAAFIHQTTNGGAYDTRAPGASEVGKIVNGRAGDLSTKPTKMPIVAPLASPTTMAQGTIPYTERLANHDRDSV